MDWLALIAPALEALINLGVKLAAERGISEADARAALVAELLSGAAAGDVDVAAVAAALTKAKSDALLPPDGNPVEPNPVQLAGPVLPPADGEG